MTCDMVLISFCHRLDVSGWHRRRIRQIIWWKKHIFENRIIFGNLPPLVYFLSVWLRAVNCPRCCVWYFHLCHQIKPWEVENVTLRTRLSKWRNWPRQRLFFKGRDLPLPEKRSRVNNCALCIAILLHAVYCRTIELILFVLSSLV